MFIFVGDYSKEMQFAKLIMVVNILKGIRDI